LPDDDPEMIRRLIAYLYLGDYDPTDALGLTAAEELKKHDSATTLAPAQHSRRSVFGGFQPLDRCACLVLNTNNVKQPTSKAEPQTKAFLYTGLETHVQIANPLTIHATMYALADKYQVLGLSQTAKVKFEQTLNQHVDSEDFIAAVQLAYSTTPETDRGLRDAVVQAFLVYYKVDITELPGMESKLDTIDELSFLLLKSWPRKTEPASCPKADPFATATQRVSHTATSAAPIRSDTSATSTTARAPTTSTFFPVTTHATGTATAAASVPSGTPAIVSSFAPRTASTTTTTANTSSSTPVTGFSFGNAPPRTSGGLFGSVQSTVRSTGHP
jgi:hypothetical protein